MKEVNIALGEASQHNLTYLSHLSFAYKSRTAAYVLEHNSIGLFSNSKDDADK